MQNIGVSNKEHYGVLLYFLEWSISDRELWIQDYDVTTQIWGLTYTQIWSKMQILEVYAATLRSVIILPPSQRRFLARLPRWQLQPYDGKLSTRQCRKAAQCFK